MVELALVAIAQQDRAGAQPGRDATTIAEACSAAPGESPLVTVQRMAFVSCDPRSGSPSVNPLKLSVVSAGSGTPLISGTRETFQLGANLHIVAVTARAPNASTSLSPVREDRVIDD